MEIHSQFLELFAEKGLLHIGNLEDLTGNIGIDGDFWLRSVLGPDTKSELLGSMSMSLRPSILSGLKPFSNFTITPVVIFPGIPLNLPDRPSYSKYWTRMAETGNLLSQNQIECKLNEETYHSIFEIIRMAKGEVMRSPYFPAAQLAYMQKAHLLSNVMGMTDLLFYQVPVIIVEVMQTRYKYLYSKEILEFFAVTPSELQQIFVMKGYLKKKVLNDLPLTALIETFKYVKAETLVNDLDLFRKTMKVIECRVSLGCGPPWINVFPNEFVKEYGMKLPKEMIYAMCVLNISPRLLAAVSLGVVEELAPIADSNNYRRLLRQLKELKSLTFSVLSSVIDQKYLKIPIKVHYWNSEIFDNIPIKPYNAIRWNIDPISLTTNLKKQKKSYADLQFCLKLHFEDYSESKSLFSESSATTDPTCLQALINLNFLTHIGYISPVGKPMLFGKSFMQCDPEWQNSALYLQELLKMGLLNGRTLSQTSCNGITQENFEKLCGMSTDDSSRHSIILISRVFSLVQPTLSEETWTGEIDYDLAQFHSLLNAVFNTYQQAYDALILKELLLGQEINSQVVNIAKKSPLLPYPHPALGIAIKKLLICDDINQVTSEMPQIADMFMDLHRGWNFWNNFVRIMNTFKIHNAVPETGFISEILTATKKLKTSLLRARIHVT